MVFLAVEMASVPSYCLAGMLKGRRESSESALKYAVFGAGTSGIMLYGISLVGGILGTVHIPTAAVQLAEAVQSGLAPGEAMVLTFAGLMIMVGLAFKLSAVPFHFWCPDVFEGASAEVNAFLSVASKAAALALLIRVAVGFAFIPGAAAAGSAPEAAATNPTSEARLVAAQVAPPSSEETSRTAEPAAERADALAGPRLFIAQLVGFLAAITCTFGNLAAYGQTNMKRLLAYSTIAHAGYMMMPVSAGIALLASDRAGAVDAFAAVGFYVAVYLFMNLGAFAVVAFLRNTIRSEEIADYAGLIRSCPGLVMCVAVIMFSLIGLPPLAGFLPKFAAFAALARAEMWTLLVIGGLNTAISLFYYLRVVKVMIMDPEPDDRRPVWLPLTSLAGGFVAIITLPLLVLILKWSAFYDPARAAAQTLFS
jgi:NADH-quinone oxidoreductase subunit N